jgi:hypothetical protein
MRINDLFNKSMGNDRLPASAILYSKPILELILDFRQRYR